MDNVDLFKKIASLGLCTHGLGRCTAPDTNCQHWIGICCELDEANNPISNVSNVSDKEGM